MFKDLKKNFQIVKYVFKFCPWYIFFTLLFITCNTIQVLTKVYLIEYFVKIVENAVKYEVNPLNEFSKIFSWLAFYLILMLIVTIYRVYYNDIVKGKYRLIYIGAVNDMMYRKARLVDYADFDNPEFYDIYSRAIRDGTVRGIRVYEDFTNFISSIVNTIALGTYIVVGDSILIIVVLISVIARLLIANKVNKNRHQFDTETEIDRRMYDYVNRTFYQQRFAAEIKTTPISELLIDKCNDAQKSIDTQYIKTHRKNTILNSISAVISNLFENGVIYCYLVYKLFKGLTLSRLSSMLNAATQFSGNFYEAASFFNRIKLNALYIDYFLDFMKYQPTLEEAGQRDLDQEFERLKIDNVTFSYPGTEFNALSNINLEIKRGDKLAIVGLNGAGKTTLIKLFLKFYNPNEGEIYYNNQTIRETKEDVIRRKYSIIFQDFRLYDVSIAENVLMREVKTEEDEKIVWKALDLVGLKEKVEALEQGIYTLYSREFNGVEFSGGERQKLAIARVFASNADIYILDEPTSSLDPLAERDINRLIMEKSQDKTIIIIAHRLSTVVDANRIILMEYGKIIEDGTHHQLLMERGKYYKMFSTQAALYIRNENKV
ncbi:MAG: ABC transporter ATP-binding protein [Bacilli bacterium]|nr:ABC transporter ATP-binding protein [Bacilli bacterium]